MACFMDCSRTGSPLRKGPKTIGDIWRILPFENFLVTGEFTPIELKVIMQEVWQSSEMRSLSGFRMIVEEQEKAVA